MKTSANVKIGLGSRLKLFAGAWVHARTHSARKREYIWVIMVITKISFSSVRDRFQNLDPKCYTVLESSHQDLKHRGGRELH